MPAEEGELRSASSGGAGPRLISIGSSDSREYSLDKQSVAIGSHSSNDIVVADASVSRRHATVTRKLGIFELADLGSTNGTFINGGRVRRPVALRRGDEIRFGSARFAFIAAIDPHAVPARAARAPSRLRRRIVILTLLFALGFVGVRYRDMLAPFAASVAARISTSQSKSLSPTAEPNPANTQAASANSKSAAKNTQSSSAPLPTAIPPANAPGWLKRLNYYRSLAKLNPVVEDPALSNGDRAHAAYIVKNFGDRIAHGGLGAEMHTEDPGREGFTPAGLEAAKSSDVDVWFMEGPAGEGAGTADPDEWTKERAPGSPQWSIDGWMSIPFHRMPMLNPTLSSAGFGFYCESGACASALNLMSGAKRSPPSAAGVASPIEFPPDGSTIGMRSFGNEWPDPLTNCAGYAPPTGLAITLQLGTWLDTKLSDYSVVRENADGANDTSIESCGYGSSDYSNPDANLQELGRGILKTSGAVVVVPRAPLDKGAKYAVSVTVNGTVYAWRFSIAK
jgi:uncharacterized protein YkwD